MRRLLNKIATNRLAWTGLLIVLQMIWLILIMTALDRISLFIRIGSSIVGILMSLLIISQNGNPSYKILWLLLIGIFPLFGCIMYLLFGRGRPSKKMRQLFQESQKSLGEDVPLDPPKVPEGRLGTLSHYLDVHGYPLYRHTETTYFPIGDEMFPQFLADLQRAEHYIFMEYFIVADGIVWQSVKKILAEKAAQGVKVRFVYDDIGSISCVPKNIQRDLHEIGVEVLSFNPFRPALSAVMNYRNHRKLAVIDGYIGYTGGLNLADEYINQKERFGHWKDSALRLYGEGVYPLTKMCLEMWNAFHETDDVLADYSPYRYHPDPFSSDEMVQPYCGSPFDGRSISKDIYIDLLAQAERYVYIFTPYIAIDDETLHALYLAAQRGVDVRVFTPGIPDKRVVYSLTKSYYLPLIQSGIRVYQYTPGFLHAKSWLIDDKVGVVGTVNLDFRALYLHMENAVLLYDPKTLRFLKEDYQKTMEASHQIQFEDCHSHRRNLLWQAFLRTISPLL